MYFDLKKKSLPSIENVQSDPLFAMSDKSDGDWHKYYQDLEEAKFIQGDLERLYITGVEENYFQTKSKQESLLHVVYVWSYQNKKLGYRQGMHEVAASIFFVMQCELDQWLAAVSQDESLTVHPLAKIITENHLEPHTYWVFERVMRQLQALYYPAPIGNDGVNYMVQYCSHVQDVMLFQADAPLYAQLVKCDVQPQLYGMRWARLLLGREFPLSSHLSLRVWDYLFTECIGTDIPVELPTDINIINKYPLLDCLRYFMLAMILNIRKDLFNEDENEVMTLLMRYPSVTDVEPIIRKVEHVKKFPISSETSSHHKTEIIEKNHIVEKSSVVKSSTTAVKCAKLPRPNDGVLTEDWQIQWQEANNPLFPTISNISKISTSTDKPCRSGSGEAGGPIITHTPLDVSPTTEMSSTPTTHSMQSAWTMPSFSKMSNKLHLIANPDLMQTSYGQTLSQPENMSELSSGSYATLPSDSMSHSQSRHYHDRQSNDQDKSVTSSEPEGDALEMGVSERLEALASYVRSIRSPAVPYLNPNDTHNSTEDMQDLADRLVCLSRVLVGHATLAQYDHVHGSAAAAAVCRKAAATVAATTKAGKSYTIVADPRSPTSSYGNASTDNGKLVGTPLGTSEGV
eukprot:CAMPEP_0182418890 /NCGR_PEP_ID=MMETSP1167-20130531/3266_1 /TAXON_ID=2988 /ORGANISM="Mallomonas Sp, Strain CCMP3275" /LENGTH=627 /DNA_ID=CAMNT_0024593351 /DNA_START=255 /DNA_END=2138 /DNA_ORIENTATION=-